MIFSVLPGMALKDIPKEAIQLHFVRSIKKELIEKILKKCSGLKQVTLSKSSLTRMPKKNIALIRKKNIIIRTETRAGRPISVPLEKMQQALEMRNDYQSLREVEKVTGISKSTVHYLEKYAQRAKIKNKGKVIYLK